MKHFIYLQLILFLIFTSDVCFSSPFADTSYIVQSVELRSSKIYQGYSGKAFLYATNTGDVSVSPRSIQIFLSKDQQFDQADSNLSTTDSLLSLRVGSTIRTDVSFDVKNTPVGKYYLIFRIGSGNSIQQLVSTQVEIAASVVDLVIEDLSISTDSAQE